MKAIEGGGTILEDIVSAISVRKRQIAITFFGIVAAVTAGTLLLPKQYESRMKILVKSERVEMLANSDGGGSGYRGDVGEEQINTEIELLDSNDLLQQVVVKSGLEQLEQVNPSVRGDRTAVAIEKAVVRLKRDLKVSPVRKANVIEIKYATTDPRRAVAVLRQLTESYLEAHLKVHATPGTYEFFSKQADRYRREIASAEASLAAFRGRANVVMLIQQKDAVLQSVSNSESALMQAEAAVREYTDKIADTRKQLEATAPRIVTQSRTVPNQYSVDHLGTMVAELENRRTQLLTKFRPDDRLIEEVSKEISDTQAALERATRSRGLEEATDINPVHATLATEMAKEQAALTGIDARRRELAKQVQSYRDQLMRLGNTTAEYDDLTRSQKEAEENYLLYSKKAEEARIAESLDQQKIANVAIAETPVEPHLPSRPNVPLNITLGVLAAGFVSLAPSFIKMKFVREGTPGAELDSQTSLGGTPKADHLLGPVESAADIEEVTGLTVLATVIRP